MKKAAYILSIAILGAFLLWAGSLFYAFAEDSRSLSYSGCGQADAIVVLTGGKGRAEEGLKLLKRGSAGVLILSGVNRDADLDSIFPHRLTNAERANIILEKNSTSTYRNAVEVRGIVKKRGITSMILITSGYHMKRAHYIFRKLMPEEISITPCGVSSPNYDEEKWWGANSLPIIFIEFVKYYLFVAGFSMGIV